MRYMLVFVVVALLSLVAASLAYWYWLPQMPAGPMPGDQIQTGTAVLGFFFATVAAFAGAVASMYVAVLGLKVSLGQEAISAITFLEERFRVTADKFSELALTSGEFYAAALVLSARMSEYFDAHNITRNNVAGLTGSPLPPQIIDENKLIVTALSNLSQAVRNIAADTVATRCLARSHTRIGSRLVEAADGMVALGYDRREAEVSFGSLADLRAFFEIAAGKLSKNEWGPLIVARLQSNVGPGATHGNASVRALSFAGNLVFAVSAAAPNGRHFHAAQGMAILHDLVRSIPDTRDITLALNEAYPELGAHSPKLKYSFDPISLVSKNLVDALRDADKVDHVYFAML